MSRRTSVGVDGTRIDHAVGPRRAIVLAGLFLVALAPGAAPQAAPPDLDAILAGLAEAHATILALISTTSDELIPGGPTSDPEWAAYDEGHIDDPTTHLLQIAYTNFETLVDAAAQATVQVDQMAAAGTLLHACDPVRARGYEALAFVMVGEFFESWKAPPPEFPPPPILPQQMDRPFEWAINRLDEAEAMAQSTAGCGSRVPAIVALRVRAAHSLAVWHQIGNQFDLGIDPGDASTGLIYQADPSQIISDVAQVRGSVSPNWRLQFDYDPTSTTNTVWQELQIGEIALGAPYTAIDGSGVAGLIDPYDNVAYPGVAQKVTDMTGATPPGLTVISLSELNLIDAEAQLLTGNVAGFADRINQVRAAQGLSPIAMATNPERLAALIFHRRAELFLDGRRLHDHYRFSQGVPAWAPTAGAAMDAGRVLPVPVSTPPPSADLVWIAPSTKAGSDPSVVLIDGRYGAGCFNDELALESGGWAPLSSNALPKQNCRSEVAVFTKRNRVILDTLVTKWTPALGDVVPEPLGPEYVVPIKVMAQSSAIATLSEVDADIATANTLFRGNRAGIQFIFDLEHDSTLPTTIHTTIPECGAEVAALPRESDVLTMYYMSTVTSDPFGWPVKGQHCARNASRNEDVILISKTASATTVAHELGHALIRMERGTPTTGEGGHTNTSPTISGFSSNNLMWSSDPGGTRNHFSLGQVYRMNAHDRSWLNHAFEVDGSFAATTTKVRDEPTRTRACQCSWIAADPCPPLAGDQGTDTFGNPILTTGGGSVGNNCYDRVEFVEPASSFVDDPTEAAALLDGRETADCVKDRVRQSTPFPVLRTHRFWYDNLLESGGCHAEFIIFSRRNRLFQHTYAPSELWTPQLADRVRLGAEVTSTPDPPFPIDVVLRAVPSPSLDPADLGFQAFVAKSRDTLAQLMTHNRGGIQFSFTPAPATPETQLPTVAVGFPGADPCAPASDFTSTALNVYFTSTLPPGASDTDGHVCGPSPTDQNVVYVKWPSTTTSITELTHQVGHAFGLEHVTSATPGFPAPSDALTFNLMHDQSSVADAARDRFTLGQVLRMYFVSESFLFQRQNAVGPTIAARCTGGDPDTCPALATDIPRP